MQHHLQAYQQELDRVGDEDSRSKSLSPLDLGQIQTPHQVPKVDVVSDGKRALLYNHGEGGVSVVEIGVLSVDHLEEHVFLNLLLVE